MFIFYLLGVGPPCRSILYQFWLCEEAQCVYLRCHLGSPNREHFEGCQMGGGWRPGEKIEGIKKYKLSITE